MFLGIPDPHPDLLVRGTDSRIRIRTKMSRIPDTASSLQGILKQWRWDYHKWTTKTCHPYLSSLSLTQLSKPLVLQLLYQLCTEIMTSPLISISSHFLRIMKPRLFSQSSQEKKNYWYLWISVMPALKRFRWGFFKILIVVGFRDCFNEEYQPGQQFLVQSSYHCLIQSTTVLMFSLAWLPHLPPCFISCSLSLSNPQS